VAVVAVLFVAACAPGPAPGPVGAPTAALASPEARPTSAGSVPSALSRQADAAWTALGVAAASASAPVPATPPEPVSAAPVVPRGPSTRTAPRVLAGVVEAGRPARVATVRVSGGQARVDVVPVTGPEQAEHRIAAAQADPAVVAVEVDHRVRLSREATEPPVADPLAHPVVADPPPLPSGSVHPASAVATQTPSGPVPAATAGTPPSDDPLRPRQWALDALGAERLWTVSRGAGQVVAVIDSGVDATHPDLAGRVLVGTDYVTASGTGWTDQFGHGTHVAGIVAAVAGNRIGISGLAPDARILPVRVLDRDGAGWDSDIAAGLLWAADQGASVINLSLGGPDASELVRAAVAIVIGRGAVVVAAAGNERADGNPVNYPAGFALPGQLGVAATTAARVSARYSNTGSYVSLAAPGDRILSTFDGSYEELSGTSMAAPYVAAVVALVRAAAPALGPVDVARLLTSTADDLEVAGRDDATGAGLVDPSAALCAQGRCPSSTTPASPSSSSASPAPSPSSTPFPAPAPMKITVRAATARVVAGRPAVLTLVISDAAGPLPGAVVRLTGPGTAATARADASGTVRLRTTATRTGVWTATASAGRHRPAAVRWSLTVVPAVGVRRIGARVVVTVTPARGQTVSVRRGATVVARRKLPTAPAANLTLRAPATGAIRVVVGAGAGLAGVVVSRAR
jgi:type VII secretion-associated serine protease mycosin